MEDKKIVDEIEMNIRYEFKQILDELNWMDNETKAMAHDKVFFNLKFDRIVHWNGSLIFYNIHFQNNSVKI